MLTTLNATIIIPSPSATMQIPEYWVIVLDFNHFCFSKIKFSQNRINFDLGNENGLYAMKQMI